MAGARTSGAGLGAMGLVAALLAGCTYDPHPADGQLQCSTSNTCPEGYECQAATDTCFAKSGGSTASASIYIGTWTFAAATTLFTTCDDGSSGSGALGVTSMAIKAAASGAGADLDAALYPCTACDLLLSVDKTGAHLSDPNPNFQNTSGDPQDFLTVNTFDLVTTNGKLAQHSATYSLEEDYADGTVIQCTQSVTTTLTKN